MLLLQNQFVISGQAQSIGFACVSDQYFLGTAQQVTRIIFAKFDVCGIGSGVPMSCRWHFGWVFLVHVYIR